MFSSRLRVAEFIILSFECDTSVGALDFEVLGPVPSLRIQESPDVLAPYRQQIDRILWQECCR